MKVSVFGLGYVGSVSAASFAGDGHRRRRRRRQRRQGRGRQRRPQPDRRARPRRTAGAVRGGRAPSRDDRHGRRRSRQRGVAALRRHAEPQERQPRPVVSRARLRADRRRAEGQAGLSRRRRPQHGAAGHDARRGHSRRSSATSGKKYGDGFGVSVNPEFLREGTALKDFRKPPLTLVGHNHAADASGTIALYQAIDAPLISTSIRVAEMMKYTSNTWHALKVVLRERDRQPLQEARRRQPRGDGHLLPRREAEPLAVLPEAGLRVRRLVPAEGRARAAVSRQGSRRRAAADLADSAEQPAADSARARSGDRHRQEERRPARLQLQGRHRRPAREPDRHPRRGAARQGLLAADLRQERLAGQAGRRQQGVHREADPAPVVAALRHDRRGHRRLRGRSSSATSRPSSPRPSRSAAPIRSSSISCGCRSTARR